jgi:hypothetical protein
MKRRSSESGMDEPGPEFPTGARTMVAAGRGGRILNNSPQGGLVGLSDFGDIEGSAGETKVWRLDFATTATMD